MSRADKQLRRGRRKEQKHQKARKRLRLELSDQPPRDVVLSSYKVTWEPLHLEAERHPAFDAAMENQRDELWDLIYENAKGAIPRLEALLGRFPDVPVVYNWLATAYGHLGEIEKYEQITKLNYQRHPGYLFAKLGMMDLCLRNGETDRVPEILENKFDLKALYPKRNVFHITEFLSFHRIIAEYHIRKGDFKEAEALLAAMEKLAPQDEQTRALRQALEGSALLRLAGRLSKRLLRLGRLPQ